MWAKDTHCTYIPLACIGEMMGMSRNWFDEIWGALTFSEQLDERPDYMSQAAYRWQLVDDFINDFNNHRRANFWPSEVICIDESISRWYGLGGNWINRSLPHYCNGTEARNGCEIQDACCVNSGIMMELFLVKGPVEEKLYMNNADQELGHGCQVMLYLLRHGHCMNLNWRIVCADSYFASTQAALRLYRDKFRFIGVIKTATRRFPKDYLSTVELPNQGTVAALNATVDGVGLLALVYCDCDRYYFISTCPNVVGNNRIEQTRLRQVENVESNEPPEHVHIDQHCPSTASLYYKACGGIDQHSCYRQDSSNLEKKLHTKRWDMRVNMTIVGMIIVDAFLLHKGCTGGIDTQEEFIKSLLSEPIKNNYGARVAARRSVDTGSTQSVASLDGTAGRGLNITPGFS